MDASTRILIGVVAAIVMLAVGAILLTRVADREASYPLDTPEGTVQRYIRAILDEDADTAIALLTEDNTDPCAADVIRDRIRRSTTGAGRHRVRLGERKEIDAIRIELTLLTTYSREPELFEFPDEPYVSEQIFEMEQSPDGFWLIAESEWPLHLEYIRDETCDVEVNSTATATPGNSP